MYRFDINEISKEDALKMIQKYHYSKTLPKINKYFLGFFLDKELVGVVTLGWGTRPRHTMEYGLTNSVRDSFYSPDKDREEITFAEH